MTDQDTPSTFKEAFKQSYKNAMDRHEACAARTHAIAMRIRILRMEKKLSQDALCKEVDIPRVTYSGYENERAAPHTEVLVRLADFYDVSLDYICCRTDKPHGLYCDEKEDKLENAEIDFLKDQLADIQKQIERLKK